MPASQYQVIDPEDPFGGADRSDLQRLDRALKAIVWMIAQQHGMTPAQARAAFRQAYEQVT